METTRNEILKLNECIALAHELRRCQLYHLQFLFEQQRPNQIGCFRTIIDAQTEGGLFQTLSTRAPFAHGTGVKTTAKLLADVEELEGLIREHSVGVVVDDLFAGEPSESVHAWVGRVVQVLLDRIGTHFEEVMQGDSDRLEIAVREQLRGLDPEDIKWSQLRRCLVSEHDSCNLSESAIDGIRVMRSLCHRIPSVATKMLDKQEKTALKQYIVDPATLFSLIWDLNALGFESQRVDCGDSYERRLDIYERSKDQLCIRPRRVMELAQRHSIEAAHPVLLGCESKKVFARTNNVIVFEEGESPIVLGIPQHTMSPGEYEVVLKLIDAHPQRLVQSDLKKNLRTTEPHKKLKKLADSSEQWREVLSFSGPGPDGKNRRGYAIS